MGASNYPDFKFAKPAPRVRVKAKKEKTDEAHKRAVYKAVDRRDKNRCVLTGRTGDRYTVDPLDKLHHHHIIEESRLGKTETWNLVTVHALVHSLIGDSRLDVYGDADEPNGLTWTIREDAVVECFGRRRVPAFVRVLSIEEWDRYIRSEARHNAQRRSA